MTPDVAHHESCDRRVETDHVVPIAADLEVLGSRQVAGCDGRKGQLGETVRQQRALEGVRDLLVALVRPGAIDDGCHLGGQLLGECQVPVFDARTGAGGGERHRPEDPVVDDHRHSHVGGDLERVGNLSVTILRCQPCEQEIAAVVGTHGSTAAHRLDDGAAGIVVPCRRAQLLDDRGQLGIGAPHGHAPYGDSGPGLELLQHVDQAEVGECWDGNLGQPMQQVGIVGCGGEHPVGVQQEGLGTSGLLERLDELLALLGPPQCGQDAPDVPAQRREQLRQLGIGLPAVVAKQLDDTPGRTAHGHGEPKGTAQPRCDGGHAARRGRHGRDRPPRRARPP